MNGSDSSDGGTKSSDFGAELPDNAAESQAAKDSASESVIEKSWSDTKAKEGADSVWSSIFGE